MRSVLIFVHLFLHIKHPKNENGVFRSPYPYIYEEIFAWAIRSSGGLRIVGGNNLGLEFREKIDHEETEVDLNCSKSSTNTDC